MDERGKSALDRLIIPIIILLVALAAFGLGRLSVLIDQKEELKIVQPQESL